MDVALRVPVRVVCPNCKRTLETIRYRGELVKAYPELARTLQDLKDFPARLEEVVALGRYCEICERREVIAK